MDFFKQIAQQLKKPGTMEDKIPLESPPSGFAESTTLQQAMEHVRSTALLRDIVVPEQQDSLQSFVQRNIRQRRCGGFLTRPQSGSDSVIRCCCGRDQEWHTTGQLIPPLTKNVWSKEDFTCIKPADSFGEIEFLNFGNPTENSPYIRVDYETHAEVAWKLLTEQWGLPTPKLVISVTGGAKKFSMKRRLKHAFINGLISAASTTGAWMISGGMGNGVMKYVGEAIQNYSMSNGNVDDSAKLVAIGIAPWGVVEGNEQLVGEPNKGKPLATYDNCHCTGGSTGQAVLDHNHTHFILVDDGTYGAYGTEITFRAEVEKFISEQYISKESLVKIPVVLIVCEGGPNTLTQVKSAIERAIPAVIIQGSGRVADVIAKAFERSRPKLGGTKSTFSEDYKAAIEQTLSRTFPSLSKESIDVAMADLEVVLSDRKLVTVFNLESEGNKDFDKAILYALLKANRSQAETQINLALTWNRADVAKAEIFVAENSEYLKTISFEDIMLRALVKNRHEFVQLFHDYGLRLSNFVTYERLQMLYEQSLDEQTTMASVVHFLIEDSSKQSHRFHTVAKIQPEQDPTKGPHLLSHIGHVIFKLVESQFTPLYHTEQFSEEFDKNKGKSLPSPARELFIWAILFNRSELANMFWKMGPDPIAAALTASWLLTRLSEEAQNREEIELSATLARDSLAYEKLACGVLTQCYGVNRERSQQLLVREQLHWGNSTLFSLAAAANQMNFMQLSCCQSQLNKLWMGRIADHVSQFKVWLCMFCPILICYLKFKSEDAAPEGILSHALESMLETSITTAKQGIPGKVRNVTFRCGRKNGDVSVAQSVVYFYTAPVVKFYHRVLSSVVFLSLLTFVCLTDLPPLSEIKSSSTIHVEILIWIWSVSLMAEELRQMVRNNVKSKWRKVVHHFKSFFNLLDVFNFTLLLVAIALRVEGADVSTVKVPYSACLLFVYLRFMNVFYVSKAIGPKIIMIQKMLKDLLFFLTILVIFILSFGVAMQSLLYPTLPFHSGTMLDVVSTPYWQIFGELFLDRVEGKVQSSDNCVSLDTYASLVSNNSVTDETMPCPQHHHLVPFLSAIYMLLTNVLLMNLLIAMFSYTFQTVQENSEKIWRFNRYFVVYEYFEKPTFVPPFVLISNIALFFTYLYRRMRKTYYSTYGFKTRFSEKINDKLSAFEKSGMDRFLVEQMRSGSQGIESRLAFAHERLDKVIEQLEEIRDALPTRN